MAYHDFITYPRPYVLTINNRYRAAGRNTALDFTFTSNIDIASGSTLVVSFNTHNLLFSMFANDL